MPPKPEDTQVLDDFVADDFTEEAADDFAIDDFAEEGPKVAVGVPIPEGPVVEEDAEMREKLRIERKRRIEEDLKLTDDAIKKGNTSPEIIEYRDKLVADYKAMDEGAKRDIEALQGGLVRRTIIRPGIEEIPEKVGGPLAGALAAGMSALEQIGLGGAQFGVQTRTFRDQSNIAQTTATPTQVKQSAQAMAKSATESLAAKERYAPTTPVEKFAADVFGAVPSLVTAVGSTALMGPVGGFATTFSLEGGSAYNDAIADGVSEEKALGVGIGVGLINGALEMVGARAILKGIGQKALAEAVNTAVEKGAMRQILSSGLKEGGTEFAQEVTNIVGEILTREKRDATFIDDAKRALYSGLVGAFAGGGLTVAGKVVRKGAEALNEKLNPPTDIKDKRVSKRYPDGSAADEDVIEVEAEEIPRPEGEFIQRGRFLPASSTAAGTPINPFPGPVPEGVIEAIPKELPEQAGPSASGMRIDVTPQGEAVVAQKPVQTEIDVKSPKQQGSIAVEGIYPKSSVKPIPPGRLSKKEREGLEDKMTVETGQYVYPEEGPARDRALIAEMMHRAARYVAKTYGIEGAVDLNQERENRIAELMQTPNAVERGGELWGEYVSAIMEGVATNLELTEEARGAAVKDLQVIIESYNKSGPAQPMTLAMAAMPAARQELGKFLDGALKTWAAKRDASGFSEQEVAIFRKIVAWVKERYLSMRGRGMHVSPELEAMFKSMFEYDKGSATNIQAQGTKVTPVSLDFNEATVEHAGTNNNLWVRQSQQADNKGRTLMVQISSKLLLGEAAGDISERYYDKLYQTRRGYDRTGDFWEVPFWMAQVGTVDDNSDVYVVRNMDEAKRFLAEAGYERIAFSALDLNLSKIKELIPSAVGSQVVIGGYVQNLRDEFSGMSNVKTFDTVEGFAKTLGKEWSPNYDYRHFRGTNIIPRLTLSKGCKYKCAFCTVPKKVTTMPKESIDRQVEAIKDLNARLVYLDDKTFGQAGNYQYLSEIYKRLKESNPDFDGFIVQTTAPDVLRMPIEWLRESGIRYVEIGVESFNDDILKKTYKVSRERTIQEATNKLRSANIALIPNIIIGLRGKNEDGTTWEETPESYQKTVDYIKRNSDIISHLNIYNLALYEGTELANQVDAKISDGQKNELELSSELYKNPEVHKQAHDELVKIGMELLDKQPTFFEATPQQPTDNVIDYPAVRNAQPSSPDNSFDLMSVEQMAFLLNELGIDTTPMTEVQIRAEFGKVPPILQKEIDESGRIKANGKQEKISGEQREAVINGGGVNGVVVDFAGQRALQFDDPLTGSTLYLMGNGPFTVAQIADKVSESRQKDWPIVTVLRDAGMTPDQIGHVTPGKARQFLKMRRPRGWKAVLADINARLTSSQQDQLSMLSATIPGGKEISAVITAALEPIIVEATAQTYVQLQKGKITYAEFREGVKAQIRDFVRSHPVLQKFVGQIEKWLKTFKPDLPKQTYEFWHYSKEFRPMLSKEYAGTAFAGEEKGRKVLHFYDSPKFVEPMLRGLPKHKVRVQAALFDLSSKAGEKLIDDVRAKHQGASPVDAVIAEIKKRGYDGFFRSEGFGKHFVQYWGGDIFPLEYAGPPMSIEMTKRLMLMPPNVSEIINLVHDFPGGVTIDPRTGTRVTSKDLGKFNAFVGMGRDVATYIKLKEKGQIKSKGVTDAIVSLLEKHADLFAKHPEYFIGTWWSENDKSLVIDIARRADAETAQLAGEWLDQKTIGVLPEIERLEAMTGEIDPEVAAMQAEKAFPVTHGKDKISNIEGLPSDIHERWSKVQQLIEENWIKIPEGEKDAPARNNIEVAKAMLNAVLATGQIPAPYGAKLRRLTNTLVRNFPKMLDGLVKGMTWYTQDVQEMFSLLRKHYPEMTKTDERVFNTILAVTSSQAGPEENFNIARKVFDWYLSHDRTLPTMHDREAFMNDFGGVEGNDVLKTTDQYSDFEILNNLANQEGGWEGALKWLTDKRPYADLVEWGKRQLISTKKKGGKTVREYVTPEYLEYHGENLPTNGAFILGPKRGAFFLNLDGNPDFFTQDSWEIRLSSFILGDLLTSGGQIRKDLAMAQRTKIIKAFEAAAAKVGLSPREFQAVTWYYIKQLWIKYGANDDGGVSYAEAAKRWSDQLDSKEAEFEFEPTTGSGSPEAAEGRQVPGPGAVPPSHDGSYGAPGEGGIIASGIFPGAPQLARLIELAVDMAKGGQRVKDPQIRAELKSFAQKRGLPPPPETLTPRDIDRYVNAYIASEVKDAMRGSGTLSMALIPGVTPAMTKAVSDYVGDLAAAAPHMKHRVKELTKMVYYNLFRATALAQIRPDFRQVYESLTDTFEESEGMEQEAIRKIDSALEGLSKNEKNRVAEAIYVGNERFETYTDIELASGVKDAKGNTVLPPMTPKEIAAYKLMREAQNLVLDMRRDTILYQKNTALNELLGLYANVQPGSRQEATLLEKIANLKNEIRLTENHYQELKDKGYVTLKRSGPIAVFAEDPTKNPDDPDRIIYDHAETWREAGEIINRFKKNGYIKTDSYVVKKLPYSIASRLTPGEFDEVLHRAGLDPANLTPELQKVRADLLSRYGSASYTLNRKFTRGYQRTPENLQKSMLGQATAYRSARFRTIGRAKAMESLENTNLRSTDRELYDFTAKYINDETQAPTKGVVESIGAQLRAITYYVVLGGEVGQFFLNAFAQPMTVTYPYFDKTEFNMKGTDAEKYFGRGWKLSAQGFKGTGPREYLALRSRADKEGLLGAPLTEALLEHGGKVSKFKHAISTPTRYGERVTRNHALAEAYLVGKEKMNLSGEELYQFMTMAVNATQARHSRGEIPGAIRGMGELGRAIYQFSSFQQLWAENLFLSLRGLKNKSAAARQLAALVALGGMSALPFASLAKILIAKLTGDDPDKWMKKHVTRSQAARDVLLYGATGQPGVSSRVKISMPFEDERARLEDRIAAVSLAKQVYRGGESLFAGQYGKAAEGLLPRALRGPVKAYRLSKEGYTPSGEKFPAVSRRQFTSFDLFLQSVGISPTPIGRYWEEERAKKAAK